MMVMYHQELLKKQNELDEIGKKRQILLELKKEEKSKAIHETQKKTQNKTDYVLGENEKIKEEKIIEGIKKQIEKQRFNEQINNNIDE